MRHEWPLERKVVDEVESSSNAVDIFPQDTVAATSLRSPHGYTRTGDSERHPDPIGPCMDQSKRALPPPQIMHHALFHLDLGFAPAVTIYSFCRRELRQG